MKLSDFIKQVFLGAEAPFDVSTKAPAEETRQELRDPAHVPENYRERSKPTLQLTEDMILRDCMSQATSEEQSGSNLPVIEGSKTGFLNKDHEWATNLGVSHMIERRLSEAQTSAANNLSRSLTP